MQSIPLRESLKGGIALIEAGQLDQAQELFRQLLAQHPDNPDVLNLTGVALLMRKENAAAAELLRRATELRPRVAEYHGNFAAALQELGRPAEMEHAARRAVEINPRFAKAWNFLAAALTQQRRFKEAIEAYCKVLEFNPGDADVRCSLGVCYFDMGDYERAVAEQRQALRLRPDHGPAHLNLALILLLLGQEEEGWEHYKWRNHAQTLFQHNFRQPLWRGSALEGQRILVLTEQGLGDAIQFVRFIPDVAARGGNVLLVCHPELKQLLSTVRGVHSIHGRDEPLPEFDTYVPLLSLPQVLGVRTTSMQAPIPYLAADAGKIDSWRRRLRQDGPGKRIGLAWGGSPSHRKDAHRSFPLSTFAPLAKVSGAKFYSLQKGPPAAELRSAPPGLELIDHTADLHTMADTAALTESLDLIVTVDTSICHLAGALGKPVWTLIAAVPHWGWGLNGETTPWYPTMRLFRQKSAGDWPGVIENVAAALGGI